MSSRFSSGEHENLMRNKLRTLNWFGQTLSDDMWDFASKQCTSNPNCGETTVQPVRPHLTQRPQRFTFPKCFREQKPFNHPARYPDGHGSLWALRLCVRPVNPNEFRLPFSTSRPRGNTILPKGDGGRGRNVNSGKRR